MLYDGIRALPKILKPFHGKRIIMWSKIRRTDTSTWNKFPAWNLGFLWYFHFNFRQNGNAKILECTSLQVFHKSLFGICCEQHIREREIEKKNQFNMHIARSFVWVLVYTALIHAEPPALLAKWVAYVECHCNLFVCCCTLEIRLIQCRLLHLCK